MGGGRAGGAHACQDVAVVLRLVLRRLLLGDGGQHGSCRLMSLLINANLTLALTISWLSNADLDFNMHNI